jgi:molybdate transport system substrate-binding protein
VVFTLASSGSLAHQVENGAPFDVFLSANDQYVKDLAASGHVDPSSVIVYATGRLALWSRDGSVKSLDDLKKPSVKHLAIPNPEHAPYGVAARQALEDRKLWTQIQPKIVYGENVSQALQFAESGNADAVITSWTLLKGRGILLPDSWHKPIRQAGAVVKSSRQTALAQEFLKFLASPEGRKILESGGLTPGR